MKSTIGHVRKLARSLLEIGSIDHYEASALEKAKKVAAVLGFHVMRDKKLGSGAFSSAYMVQRDSDGFRGVLKISDNETEWVSYARVEKKRKTLSPDVAKHLPEILAAGTIESLGIKTLPFTAYVISEFLKPMPPQVAKMWDDATSGKMPKDLNVAHELIKNALDESWRNDRNLRTKFRSAGVLNVIENEISKQILLNLSDPKKSITTAVANLGKNPALRDLFSDPGLSGRFFFWAEDLAYEILYLMKDKQLTTYGREPGHPSNDKLSPPDSALIANVRNAFEEMAKAGIIHGDVHQGNVMIRPSTGDVVVSDVGLFQVTENRTRAV